MKLSLTGAGILAPLLFVLCLSLVCFFHVRQEKKQQEKEREKNKENV